MSMKPIHAQVWANWENNPHPLHCHGMELEGRQRLFEKALTPSDVGKLNRLVIPKQHAEKHFPLDGEAGEKGLLLSFEDESGKPWRFRYSYWGSSQSYVLTKGWSRFVKEKKLDAGDVVLFERLRGCGGERLSISCRRRRGCGGANESPPAAACTAVTASVAAAPGSHVCYVPPVKTPPTARPCLALAASSKAMAPTQSKRRLRLFGVNLDCTPETTAAGPELRQGQFMPAIDASTADQSQYEIGSRPQ